MESKILVKTDRPITKQGIYTLVGNNYEMGNISVSKSVLELLVHMKEAEYLINT